MITKKSGRKAQTVPFPLQDVICPSVCSLVDYSSLIVLSLSNGPTGSCIIWFRFDFYGVNIDWARAGGTIDTTTFGIPVVSTWSFDVTTAVRHTRKTRNKKKYRFCVLSRPQKNWQMTLIMYWNDSSIRVSRSNRICVPYIRFTCIGCCYPAPAAVGWKLIGDIWSSTSSIRRGPFRIVRLGCSTSLLRQYLGTCWDCVQLLLDVVIVVVEVKKRKDMLAYKDSVRN